MYYTYIIHNQVHTTVPTREIFLTLTFSYYLSFYNLLL